MKPAVKKGALGLLTLIGAAGGCIVVYLLFNGPHMRYQAHLRAFEWAMPAPPPGSVPVHPRPSLPAAGSTERNPLSGSEFDVARGKVDYEYYCIFCHGQFGDGNGPVGQSYTPRPANLRTRPVRELSDAELLRRSMLGTGHEPVLGYVVPPGERWYLVTYVRNLPEAR